MTPWQQRVEGFNSVQHHKNIKPQTYMNSHTSSAIPLPLLITGVAGVVGYNAFAYFRAKYGEQVIGTRRVDNWPLTADGIAPCNIDQRDELAALFEKHEFAAVLNCGGSCALKSCELDPEMSHRVNVQSVENLLSVISPSTRLIHLSIDLVFSGEGEGDYTESARTDPVTVYGASMVAGEQLVLANRPDACLLRISLPMGVSFNGHAGAIDWIQSRFAKNRPATLYFDEVRTPTFTDCLNPLFETILRNDLGGLYHAGAPRKLSLYQIAQVINRIGGYDPDLLQGCPRMEAGPMPPRAGNVTLDSSRIETVLGADLFDPWPLSDEHAPTHDRWHYERESDSEPGSPEKLHRLLYCNSNKLPDHEPMLVQRLR